MKKMEHRYKRYVLWLTAIVSALILTGCGAKKSIDLSEYVTVRFTGADGYGTATYEFDIVRFDEDYGDKLKYNDKTEANENPTVTPCMLVPIVFIGEIEDNGNLSNGDPVTFRWLEPDWEYVERVFNYTFELEPVMAITDGLEQIEMFDAFEGIGISTSDFEPCIKARINNSKDEKYQRELRYRLDKEEGLSNGDVVTVTIKSPMSDYTVEEYCMKKYGMLPMATTKEFTIEGHGHYVTSIDELPEDVLEKMYQDTYEDFLDQGETFFSRHCEVESFEHIGEYILTRNDGRYNSYYNMIYMLYKVTMRENFSEYGIDNTVEYYYYSDCQGVKVNADGSFDAEFWGYPSMDPVRHTINRKVNAPSGVRDVTVFKYVGYETLDELFESDVKIHLNCYDFISTVNEGE